MTNLPPSQGNTVVLDISKCLYLIPLPKLPMAFETVELLFNHVFRYFGLPEDIASDQKA